MSVFLESDAQAITLGRDIVLYAERKQNNYSIQSG